MSDDTPTGTCRVYQEEENGRWHIAKLSLTGLFGLGPNQWQSQTVIGYRNKERAERKAARIQKKAIKWYEKRERERSERLGRAAGEDAFIRSKVEEL